MDNQRTITIPATARKILDELAARHARGVVRNILYTVEESGVAFCEVSSRPIVVPGTMPVKGKHTAARIEVHRLASLPLSEKARSAADRELTILVRSFQQYYKDAFARAKA